MHTPVGPDSAVGTATCYGYDGPGIESRLRGDFPHSSRLALETTHIPIQWARNPFPGDKAVGTWR